MVRYRLKVKAFASFAHNIEKLSVCTRHSTGCVIFDCGCTKVLSVGYNGPGSGVDHSTCTGEVGKCGCMHAEINALIKLTSQEPALLYSTVKPCFNCATAILNTHSIVGVLYEQDCRHVGSELFLAEHGVPCYQIGRVTDDILYEWKQLGPRHLRIAKARIQNAVSRRRDNSI